MSAYVRAHVRVRVRAGAYKRVHVCSCVLVYVVRVKLCYWSEHGNSGCMNIRPFPTTFS